MEQQHPNLLPFYRNNRIIWFTFFVPIKHRHVVVDDGRSVGVATGSRSSVGVQSSDGVCRPSSSPSSRRKPHKSGQGAKSFFPLPFYRHSFPHTIFLPSCLRFVGTLFRHFLFADLHLLIQLLCTWWSRQHLPRSPNTSSAAAAAGQKCAKCAKLREFLFVLGLTAQGEVVYRSRWYLIRLQGRFRGHCYSLCRNRVVLDLLLKEFSFMLRNFIRSLNGVTNPSEFVDRERDS